MEILTTLIEKYKGKTCVLYMVSFKRECDNKAQMERGMRFTTVMDFGTRISTVSITNHHYNNDVGQRYVLLTRLG